MSSTFEPGQGQQDWSPHPVPALYLQEEFLNFPVDLGEQGLDWSTTYQKENNMPGFGGGGDWDLVSPQPGNVLETVQQQQPNVPPHSTTLDVSLNGKSTINTVECPPTIEPLTIHSQAQGAGTNATVSASPRTPSLPLQRKRKRTPETNAYLNDTSTINTAEWRPTAGLLPIQPQARGAPTNTTAGASPCSCSPAPKRRREWTLETNARLNDTSTINAAGGLPTTDPIPIQPQARGAITNTTAGASPCSSPPAPKRRRKWTPEMDACLKESRRQGMTHKETCEVLETKFGTTVTPNMVTKRWKVINDSDSTVSRFPLPAYRPSP